MASLITLDYKISDSKDCDFHLYIFFLPLTSLTTLHISQRFKNVSWINVELMNEQMNGKLCKQIKYNDNKKQKTWNAPWQWKG